MKVLITGSGGFLGQFLARKLLEDPSHQLILTDLIDVEIPKGSKHPQNAKVIKGDLFELLDQVVTKDLNAGERQVTLDHPEIVLLTINVR